MRGIVRWGGWSEVDEVGITNQIKQSCWCGSFSGYELCVYRRGRIQHQLDEKYGMVKKRNDACVEVHETGSKFHTILSAICSAGVVNVSFRKPVKFQTKKRKLGQDTAKKKKKNDVRNNGKPLFSGF